MELHTNDETRWLFIFSKTSIRNTLLGLGRMEGLPRPYSSSPLLPGVQCQCEKKEDTVILFIDSHCFAL